MALFADAEIALLVLLAGCVFVVPCWALIVGVVRDGQCPRWVLVASAFGSLTAPLLVFIAARLLEIDALAPTLIVAAPAAVALVLLVRSMSLDGVVGGRPGTRIALALGFVTMLTCGGAFVYMRGLLSL